MLEDNNLTEYNKQFLNSTYEYPHPFLMHKYNPPNQGYHYVHEDWSGWNYARYIAAIIYLNDVYEGGETEFINQKLKVKPMKGTIILFPPYYTHKHRGNRPISNSKYIMTSWYSFKRKGPRPSDIGFYYE